MGNRNEKLKMGECFLLYQLFMMGNNFCFLAAIIDIHVLHQKKGYDNGRSHPALFLSDFAT